ncbi:metalloregulator ArsR/SmtB family transcription factor [bacterium]|nr:metalloregulator ArsR/SmtB family transcription factor [bacterium]
MKQEHIELFLLHANFCKTMGNAKRLMILSVLAEGEASVGEIAEKIGAPMTNVSQHLNILKSSSIVRSRKDGQLAIYSLTDPRITDACDLVRSVLLSFMKERGTMAKEMDMENLTR